MRKKENPIIQNVVMPVLFVTFTCLFVYLLLPMMRKVDHVMAISAKEDNAEKEVVEVEPTPTPTATPTATPTPTPTPTPEVRDYSGEGDPRFTDTDSILIVANKKHALGADYVPKDLAVPEVRMTITEWSLRLEAAEAIERMFAAAEADGVILYLESAYRSYDTQDFIYNGYVEQSGRDYADTISARPGYSDHQTGLAVDITGMNDLEANFSTEFEDTAEGKWLAAHAHEYGFIMRYPKGKESITGYAYEPWHFRYIGVEDATAIYETDPYYTFEEYFHIEGGDYKDREE